MWTRNTSAWRPDHASRQSSHRTLGRPSFASEFEPLKEARKIALRATSQHTERKRGFRSASNSFLTPDLPDQRDDHVTRRPSGNRRPARRGHHRRNGSWTTPEERAAQCPARHRAAQWPHYCRDPHPRRAPRGARIGDAQRPSPVRGSRFVQPIAAIHELPPTARWSTTVSRIIAALFPGRLANNVRPVVLNRRAPRRARHHGTACIISGRTGLSDTRRPTGADPARRLAGGE